MVRKERKKVRDCDKLSVCKLKTSITMPALETTSSRNFCGSRTKKKFRQNDENRKDGTWEEKRENNR